MYNWYILLPLNMHGHFTYFFGMSVGKCSKFTKASTIFEYLVGPPDKGVSPGVAPDWASV